ncbi:MAG: hypothetical protein QOF40_26, partial [Actinomycetota bacterium]|nr:hypothetical protein [Actinomycetota bacterium]
MLSAAVLAVAAGNRWLLIFSITALVVLVGGSVLRKMARGTSSPKDGENGGERRRGGIRRRGGGLLAVGPLVGLALAPHFTTPVVLVAVGGAVLVAYGLLIERSPRGDMLAAAGVAAMAAVAVATGVELGPTSVRALDILGAACLIIGVTKSIDGLGNVDGLAAETGGATAFALFAVAGFGLQNGLAGVFIGLAAGCIGLLAFNLRPASLFVGRGGRLGLGFMLATGALVVDPVPGSGRELIFPLMLLALFWFDAAVVVVARLRRRQSLLEHRADHLVHRLAALGWKPSEAVSALFIAQCVLGLAAILTARAVMPTWLGAGIALLVLLVFAIEVGRARLEREHPVGVETGVKIAVGVLVVAAVVSLVPLALMANETVDLMQQGRIAATRALVAARDGDTITAQGSFNEAARSFGRARDDLQSPALFGGSAIPFLASNVDAARTLAEIGTDLANAGENLTTAVHPEALRVIDGTLPLDEVRKITPRLEAGSVALTTALDKLDRLRGDPYLLPQITDAVDKVYDQLARAEAEAKRGADAAKLAPAIFGGDGPRRYLLVVQNNADSRATGGFIGSYAIMTAENGKVTVGDQVRIGNWNATVRMDPNATLSAPVDYLRRYAQFQPKTTAQNVNLSPDFPSVSQALMSVAPSAGAGPVDGVMAVDPQGLAALLELSGPVRVAAWPTEIDAGNVVNVTLRDAYAVFDDNSPERADFLGDVAQAAVKQATSGELGKPAQIAKVLGKAAHEGHLSLAFARPAEQRLAEELGVAQKMGPIRSDAFAVTTSNTGGNKIDYYLKRTIDYRVNLVPSGDERTATARAELSVVLENTAPSSGLPQYVIGPFDARFVAGESRSYLSLYSPLIFKSN